MILESPTPAGKKMLKTIVIAAVILAGLAGQAGAAGNSPRGLIASDASAKPNPLPFWGAIECASQTRHRFVRSGGDPHPAAGGKPQGNRGFRRLTVIDGDDFYGERCELGFNNSGGPTVFYRPGSHVVTWISIRLAKGAEANQPLWRTVMQMKQAQPYDSDADAQGFPGVPILSLEQLKGEWLFMHANQSPGGAPCRERGIPGLCWAAPARAGVWTRFRFDVVYSTDPASGSIKVSADLNRDEDFKDDAERGTLIHLATLRTESGPENIDPDIDGLAIGDPISSHLRAGIYQDPAHSCPPPNGCSVDIDNVQIVQPGR
jgi:hypothetical protein